jgi:AraC-like DNA-binding protein
MKLHYYIVIIVLFLLNSFLTEFSCQDINSESKFAVEKKRLIAKLDSVQTDSAKLNCYLDLSNLLSQSSPEEAVPYLSIVNKLTESDTISKYRSRYYAIKGKMFLVKSNYKKASSYFLRALKIAEKINDIELIESILNSLAINNIRAGLIKTGIKYFKRLLVFAERENNPAEKEKYLLNLSLAYSMDNQFDAAEKTLLQIFSETKNVFYKAVSANSLSFIYNNSQRFPKAVFYGRKAVELSQQTKNNHLFLETLINYSNGLKGIKSFVKAEKVMERALQLAKKSNFNRDYVDILGNIAYFFHDQKDYKKGFDYLSKYLKQKDSLANKDIAKQIQELQVKYETEKKEKLIVETKTKLEKKETQSIIFLISGVTFVVVALIIFVLYRKKNNAYKNLVRINMELVNNEDSSNRIRNDSDKVKYSSSTLSKSKSDELIQLINKVIFEDKIFLQNDITLGKLAQKLNVNTKYISQVIHETYNMGFSDFINSNRIKEAIRLLSDESYNHITIEGISEIVGFKTKSSFNIYFKKFTGVTPSFFASNSQKQTKIN